MFSLFVGIGANKALLHSSQTRRQCVDEINLIEGLLTRVLFKRHLSVLFSSKSNIHQWDEMTLVKDLHLL